MTHVAWRLTDRWQYDTTQQNEVVVYLSCSTNYEIKHIQGFHLTHSRTYLFVVASRWRSSRCRNQSIGWTVRVSIPDKSKAVSLFTKLPKPAVVPTKPPIRWVTGVHSPTLKRLEREDDRSHLPPRLRIRGVLRTSTIGHHGVGRDNFIGNRYNAPTDDIKKYFSTGRGPVPGPGINYTGSREVLLEFVILVF